MSDLSALEQRRLANISRNEAFLSELGLDAPRGNRDKKIKKKIDKKVKNNNTNNSEIVNDIIRLVIHSLAHSLIISYFNNYMVVLGSLRE